MKRSITATLCAALASLTLAGLARGATDPLFVFTPSPPPPPAPTTPPPTGYLNGPCGIGVDSSGRLYVSDYYHHAVDVFTGTGYSAQLVSEDPQDGPCGLALNSSNQLYVNNYHRNVTKFNASPSFGSGAIFPLPEEDTAHHLPTGVAVDTSTNRVYVNHRTYVSVFDSAGNPVLDEGVPLKIGEGTLGDGYGVAISQYVATVGRLYVPDAATNTVKVYDPLVSKTTPVSEVKDPFSKPFVSLRDSAIAVDRVTGDIYFADNHQPEYTEKPQASIFIYSATNVYKGRLKYNVIDALPAGLAVDNSTEATQGRVYVTSGNTDRASVYAYDPGSGTFGTPLPPLDSGLSAPGSSSGGSGAGEALSSAATSFAPAKAAAQATTSVVTQRDNLQVSMEGRLVPRKLPRKGKAPISVQLGWEISTVDGSPPPKLKTLRIEISREGSFETEGLPTCKLAKIQPASTKRALSNCRASLVGRGSFSARVSPKGPGGESDEARGRLLVFNGERKGKPVLYGQIYSAHPFATSFVIVFAVKDIARGTWGTSLTATLPKVLRSWGELTGIQMRLSRRYGFKGKRRSYVSAGCPASVGSRLVSFKLVRTSSWFIDGKGNSSTAGGVCRARK